MANKKQIIFFCATTPYVMIYKIAREFKKRGYETVLITISQKDKWEKNWYQDGFDKIICSDFQIQKPNLKNTFNMLKRTPPLLKSIFEMKKLRPYVVFTIARPNYIAAIGMKFFKRYPLIYFPYDINAQIKDVFGKIKQYEVNAEKYCFQNAEGILHKGAPEELDFLQLKKPKIHFHPYCSNEFIVPINKNKLSKKDKEIHMVYVGGLFLDRKSLLFYRSLFKKLINQKIHIHIYGKTQHLSKKEDIKNFSRLLKPFLKNKYFHMEFSVPPKKLILEISRCDFGLWLDHSEKIDNPYISYSTGNKISTFLEAGIPFCYAQSFSFLDRLMKQYDLGELGFDKVSYNFIKKIKKMNYQKLRKNVIKARKDFNIKKQFPRLENFIKEIIQNNKNIKQ